MLTEITQEELNKKIILHKQWLESDGKKGEKLVLVNYDLSGLNLSYDILSGANLSGADLSGADLDFSSGLPFWYGGVNVIVDNRIQIQSFFHAYKQINEDENPDSDLKELLESDLLKKVIRKFHRFDKCGGFNQEEK